jgi:hypothetical protein
MAELYLLESVIARAGRSESDTHGNSFLFEGATSMSDAQTKSVIDGYIALARPALMASLQIYAVRVSPVPAPGQIVVNRNDHMTIKPKDFVGLNALPGGKQMADLTYCAKISKSAARGVTGAVYLRGFCDEDEINTDDEGRLLDPVGDVAARLNTYQNGLISNFKRGGGRGLVLPGPKRLTTGEYVSAGIYIASAREVTAVSVERLTRRQLEVSRNSVDAKRLDLLRAEINRLQRTFNEAKRAANGGALPERDTDRLNSIGEEIFERYDSSERNRVKIPRVLTVYVRDRR